MIRPEATPHDTALEAARAGSPAAVDAERAVQKLARGLRRVFIELFDDADEHERAVAERFVSAARMSGHGVVSHQVVQEALDVMTRRLGASTDDARRFLAAVLDPLWRIGPSTDLCGAALDVRASCR